MKHYVVIAQSSGGCDYSIGCGTAIRYINAESMDEACQKAMGTTDISKEQVEELAIYKVSEYDAPDIFGELGTSYYIDEHHMNSVTVIEIGSQLNANMDVYRKKLNKYRQLLSDIYNEENEKKELARLKVKYGDI